MLGSRGAPGLGELPGAPAVPQGGHRGRASPPCSPAVAAVLWLGQPDPFYEAWTGTARDPARRSVTGIGTISLPTIARNLETLGDSVPCTYERES